VGRVRLRKEARRGHFDIVLVKDRPGQFPELPRWTCDPSICAGMWSGRMSSARRGMVHRSRSGWLVAGSPLPRMATVRSLLASDLGSPRRHAVARTAGRASPPASTPTAVRSRPGSLRDGPLAPASTGHAAAGRRFRRSIAGSSTPCQLPNDGHQTAPPQPSPGATTVRTSCRQPADDFCTERHPIPRRRSDPIRPNNW
jgi:hypothetical protein